MQEKNLNGTRVIIFRWDEILTPKRRWVRQSFKLVGNVMVVAKSLEKLANLKKRFISRNVRAIAANTTKGLDFLDNVIFEAQAIFGQNYSLLINFEEE